MSARALIITVFLLASASVYLFSFQGTAPLDYGQELIREGIIRDMTFPAGIVSIEEDGGGKFDVVLLEDSSILDVFGREIKLPELKLGYIVRAEGRRSDIRTMVARNIKIIDTPGIYEITRRDREKTFTYKVDMRFSVVLESPQELICHPGGIIKLIEASADKRVTLFEGKKMGTCILRGRDFKVVIRVVK